MNCTRCQGTGFLNLEQVPDEVLNPFNATGDVGLILAWIDETATRVGYEISFTRYFYKPQPLRTLEEIRADILALEKETEGLLGQILLRTEATS